MDDTTTSTKQEQQQQQQQTWTSVSAPGKIFTSRTELALHYNSPWHVYNVKRRQANLSVLSQSDFEARYQAAQEVYNNKKTKTKQSSHLKADKVRSRPKPQPTLPLQEQTQEETNEPPPQQQKQQQQQQPQQEETIEINVCQSLFDNHISNTVQENFQYLYDTYGLFVPDAEYLVHPTLLMGYLHETILAMPHTCLYCRKEFSSAQSTIQHMLHLNHTKIRYESGYDLEQLQVFYDFTQANQAFLGPSNNHNNNHADETVTENDDTDARMEEEDNDDDDDDDDWEDVSLDDDEDDLSFAQQIKDFGLSVNQFGELVFSNGRSVGHRSLRRYYKQRHCGRKHDPAKEAAKLGARERLFRGRVYQLGYGEKTSSSGGNNGSDRTTRATKTLNRSANGLLVPAGVSSSSGSNFTTRSLFRYQAAILKMRKSQVQNKKLHDKAFLNTNKMDKKANRLYNNVSVAHAPR